METNVYENLIVACRDFQASSSHAECLFIQFITGSNCPAQVYARNTWKTWFNFKLPQMLWSRCKWPVK